MSTAMMLERSNMSSPISQAVRTARPQERVHLFLDLPNIFWSARIVAAGREGASAERLLRLHYDNLIRLAHAGREVASGVCVTSYVSPSGAEPAWLHRLRRERGSIEIVGVQRYGPEQGVDERLQTEMLRKLADSEPETAILMTGDGAGYEEGRGFLADLERLARGGWAVETLAWNLSCSVALRKWAEANGAYIALDQFYEAITFLEGLRLASPLSLVHRPRASPPDGFAGDAA
jgi:NYN domain